MSIADRPAAPQLSALDIAAESQRDQDLTASHNLAQIAASRIERDARIYSMETIRAIDIDSEYIDNLGDAPSPRWTIRMDLRPGAESMCCLVAAVERLAVALRTAAHMGS